MDSARTNSICTVTFSAIQSCDDLSTASWIALLGLAIVRLGVIPGLAIAGELVRDNDEAAVGGIVWGGLARTVLGGLIVGALRPRWAVATDSTRRDLRGRRLIFWVD